MALFTFGGEAVGSLHTYDFILPGHLARNCSGFLDTLKHNRNSEQSLMIRLPQAMFAGLEDVAFQLSVSHI
ncbi:unnamed protein product [Cylicocyclus nassatus]|uniref:Uncharacterized protein n=1 Tax=Cylicocyclus nassatus TaxID=53992 RepID=A0AA36GPA8_CYLNA|nr:unnamed protein product [Cylicocyclus nassatus]